MLKFIELVILKEGYFYLFIALFLFFYWFLNKRIFKVKFLKLVLKVLIVFILSFAFLKTIFNYYFWLTNPLSRKFLPPYTPIFYFLRYSFQHYFFAPILTITFALLVSWLILKFNKKFEETFFYEEEPYLAAIGILLNQWPKCLIFLVLVLFLGIVSHLGLICFYYFYRKEKKEEFLGFRLSLINFWLPCALLVLLLSDIMSKLKIVEYLKV